MATLTIKKVPDSLYEKLKDEARNNRRSINSEVIVCLEVALNPVRTGEQDLLERISAVREAAPLYVAEGDLRDAIDEGRP